MSGWIKLHRKFLQWEWYDDVNTSRLFLHLLLSANYKDKPWHGTVIKRGQYRTSLSKLSSETKLSIKSVRTALTKLKSTGEVAEQATNLSRLLTIVKYEEYQANEDEGANDSANEGQTRGKRGATTKEEKKRRSKEVKNINIPIFENFWLAYPKARRCEKPDALKAWTIACQAETPEKLFDSLQAYLKTKECKDGFAPYPAKWLRKERYNEDFGSQKRDYSGILP